MKGTLIAKYNALNEEAREQENKQDWKHAAKLWRAAQEVAEKQSRRGATAYCGQRADFCDGMVRRAAK